MESFLEERIFTHDYQKLPYHVIREILLYYVPRNFGSANTIENAIRQYYGYFRHDRFRKIFLIFRSLWCHSNVPKLLPSRMDHITFRMCEIAEIPEKLNSLMLWSVKNTWGNVKEMIPKNIETFSYLFPEDTIPFHEIISPLPKTLKRLTFQDKSGISNEVRINERFPELLTFSLSIPLVVEIPVNFVHSLPSTLKFLECSGTFKSAVSFDFLVKLRNLKIYGSVLKIRSFPPNLHSLRVVLDEYISKSMFRLLPESLKVLEIRKYNSLTDIIRQQQRNEGEEEEEDDDDILRDVDFKLLPIGLQELGIRRYENLNGEFLNYLRNRTKELRRLEISFISISRRSCLPFFRLLEPSSSSDNEVVVRNGIRSLDISNCKFHESFFHEYSDYLSDKLTCSLRILKVCAKDIGLLNWKVFIPELKSLDALVIQIPELIDTEFLLYLPRGIRRLTLLGRFLGSRCRSDLLKGLRRLKFLEYLRISKVFGLGKESVKHILDCKSLRKISMKGTTREKVLKDEFVQEILKKQEKDLDIDNITDTFHISME